MFICGRLHSGVEKLVLLAGSTIFCVYLLATSNVEIPIVVQWKSDGANGTSRSSAVGSNQSIHHDAFDECVLRVYDPFYKDIKKVIVHKEPLKDCNRDFKSPTQLIDGKVSIHPARKKEYDVCSASCLQYINAIRTTPGIWRNFTKGETLKMNCDFVYTRCFKDNKNVDEFVHMQLVEEKQSTTPSPKPKHVLPNVYVIAIDSVSSTQALRSLPKTMEFLKRNMSAVFFNHLQKVGENTRPNAYAISLGWRIMETNRMAMGVPNLPPQIDWETVCSKYRDNDPTIFNAFKSEGYKTAFVEDWHSGDFYSYPNCRGTFKQHANHTIRPLVNIIKEKSIQKNYNKKNCFEIARHVLDYTGMFVRAYKDQPKFSLSWMATISHDDANLLFHEDDYFEAFFKEHEELFRDSFVFFMGDHGIRFGTNLNTELGKREINNPFLMITVPQFLRRNEKLMGTMEENAMKMVTQYDVHATLHDIGKVASKSNYTDFKFKTIFEDNPNNATSLLRPMGAFSRRNCKNVPVSFQFCLCEYNMEEITSDEFKSEALDFLVVYINNLIDEHNATELCPKLEPDRVISMRAYAPEQVYRLYEIVFVTKPGGGIFKGHLHYNAKTESFSVRAKLERLNAYGHAGDCVKKDLNIVLFCNCAKKL